MTRIKKFKIELMLRCKPLSQQQERNSEGEPVLLHVALIWLSQTSKFESIYHIPHYWCLPSPKSLLPESYKTFRKWICPTENSSRCKLPLMLGSYINHLTYNACAGIDYVYLIWFPGIYSNTLKWFLYHLTKCSN